MYLVIGGLWCLVINLVNALLGAPSAFQVLLGDASVPSKVVMALRIAGEQVLLWPLQLYERVLRAVIG
jgi:hypothetical protein